MEPSGHALMVVRNAHPRHVPRNEPPAERTWYAPGGRSGSFAELFPGPPAAPAPPGPERTTTRKLRSRRQRAAARRHLAAAQVLTAAIDASLFGKRRTL